MQNKWLYGAAALTGILLALLLLPLPYTGSSSISRVAKAPTEMAPPSVPEAPNTPEEAPDGEEAEEDLEEPPAEGLLRPDVREGALTRGPIVKPADELAGPNPLAAENAALRQRPEAIVAGQLTSPLTLVRRNLLQSEDPEQKELGRHVNQLILDLREMRRDPESQDFDALRSRVQDTLEQIGSYSADDEEIQQSMERLVNFLSEYEANNP